MWYELLKHIKKELGDENIYLGSEIVTQADFNKGNAIILTRGEEEKGDENVENELKSTIYLETWVREDSNKLENGYKKLSELETKIENKLTELRKDIGKLNRDRCIFSKKWQILDFLLEEKRASDESLRPLYGTLYILKFRIYDLEENGGIW